LNNDVLDHALDVENNTAKLSRAALENHRVHLRDEADIKVARTALESAQTAHSDLTDAMTHVASSTAKSKESLKVALASGRALEQYKESEKRKTRTARRRT
jgi:hypothetical protein